MCIDGNSVPLSKLVQTCNGSFGQPRLTVCKENGKCFIRMFFTHFFDTVCNITTV